MFQLKWVWKNMEGSRLKFVFALLLAAIAAAMRLISPIISKNIVDLVIVGQTDDLTGQTVHHIELLIPLVTGLVLFTLLRSALGYLMIILTEQSSQHTVFKIRNKLYENLGQQDMRFYANNRTGDIMTCVTGDLDKVRHNIAWVSRNATESIVMFLSTTVYFLTVDPLLTLILLAIAPLIFIVTVQYSKKVRPLYRDLREKLSGLSSDAQENIEGNRVVKAFAREEYEKEKFDEKNAEFREASLKASLKWQDYYPIIESLAQSLSVVTLLVGGYFVMIGRLTLGELSAFSALTWTLSNPMRMLGTVLNELQRFFVSADKVIELYYAQPLIKNRLTAKKTDKRFSGKICFENVGLKSGKTTVLSDINLQINPGETVVIMGNTGSGKTSLINLIVRLCDVTSGRVTVDGVDVRDWDLQTLRKNIGFATQDVFLFSDTVDGNIAYGNSSMSEENVQKYAQLAAANFISRLSSGYDTVIGERGVGLSGGQKQRIALARAMAIEPSILILDDTTSAVDMETERYIQKSLKALSFPCTKIIIAQRVSAAKNADRIIVLNNGTIIENGTHEELIKKKGYYYDIYAIQQSLDTADKREAV